MSFTYNVDGLRISKTVDGVTTHYIYDGNVLLSEYTDTEIIVYIYDALGSPIGFKYRDSSYETDAWDVYWYEKNLQGRRVKIIEYYFHEYETAQSKELKERAGRPTRNDYATVEEI